MFPPTVPVGEMEVLGRILGQALRTGHARLKPAADQRQQQMGILSLRRVSLGPQFITVI